MSRGVGIAQRMARLILKIAYRATPGLKRQTCKVCWKADKLDFHVPDEIWEAVVPVHMRTRVVCLACFDDFARVANISYAPHLREIYFAGDRGSLELRAVSAVDVRP